MPREEEDEKGEAKTEDKTPFEAERKREAEESKETEAQVPREEESKEVGKTEAKARPRFDFFVPLLLTPVFFGGAFGPAVGPDFARHRLQQSALQWLPCQYHAVQGEKCR